MAAIEYWKPAHEEAVRGRYRFLLSLLPWAGVAVTAAILYLIPPPGWDPALIGFALAMSVLLLVLMIRDGYRRYQTYYQAHVLPQLVASHTPLRSDPRGGVSMFVLEPSRLFPGGEKIRTHAYLRGVVDDHLVELSALDMTRMKVIRKVRKVQKPVFSGAVFCFDLGSQVLPGDVQVFGSRARRPWAQRRLTRNLLRMPMSGTGFGVRVYGEMGTRKIWSPEAREALVALMKLVPNARVSFFDGRHMVVAVPRFHKFFKPAGIFLSPRRDPHMGRVLSVFRAITQLGVSLGAQPERVYSSYGYTESGMGRGRALPYPVQAGLPSVGDGHDESSPFPGMVSSEKTARWAQKSSALFQSGAYKLGRFWVQIAPLRERAGKTMKSVTREGVKTARDVGEMVRHTNAGERLLERLDRYKGRPSNDDKSREEADLEAMRRFARRDDD